MLKRLATPSARYMCDKLNKKSKKQEVKPFMVKNHLWVFCNAQIVNPAFDSQVGTQGDAALPAMNAGCP